MIPRSIPKWMEVKMILFLFNILTLRILDLGLKVKIVLTISANNLF